MAKISIECFSSSSFRSVSDPMVLITKFSLKPVGISAVQNVWVLIRSNITLAIKDMLKNLAQWSTHEQCLCCSVFDLLSAVVEHDISSSRQSVRQYLKVISTFCPFDLLLFGFHNKNQTLFIFHVAWLYPGKILSHLRCCCGKYT